MPRLVSAVPKYRLHRPSGQAVVSLGGCVHYLGPYGTKASHLEYDRRIAEWLASGRQSLHSNAADDVTFVVEVCAAYKQFAESYYRKNGVITNEVTQIISALSLAQSMYGREPAGEFGPLKLQAIQQAMIARKWSRKHINKQISRIVRAFSWATSKEMVPGGVVQTLREVPGLRKGRSSARETAPVLPVTDETVERTLPHLPPVVADMVRVQRLTGCRPEDVCRLRPSDLDRAGDVWKYTPQSHKTEHHGRERTIFIGPKAQAILKTYLNRLPEEYCFSPRESENLRRNERRKQRVTPRGRGNGPGSNRVSEPRRVPQKSYTTASYRRAIHRACEATFAMPARLRRIDKALPEADQEKLSRERDAWRATHLWSPNQLRHTAATEVRKRYGLEAAQIVLGHAAADVTQVYAERDLVRGADIMRQIG